jgi:origin recognition complex subunit 6
MLVLTLHAKGILSALQGALVKSINNTLQSRLKQTLNLPKIEPRPPCPPRIYGKLYAYLDRTLIVRKRGRLGKSESATSTPTKPVPTRSTPTKAASLAPYKTTPGSASNSRKRGLRFTDAGNDVAVWIPFAVRALCKELNAPAAVPHVLAGVTTILTQRSPFLGNCEENLLEDKKDKQPALIAAVYCFVGTRMSGRETNGVEYVAQRKLMLTTLKQFGEDEAIAERIRKKWKGKKDMEWEGWEDVTAKDVDSWLLHISSRGWLSLDWFENIVEGSGLGPNGNPGDGAVLATETGAADWNKDPQQRGPGTMMQDRVDYLSEKKRADYKVWREHIIAKIEEMEKEID